ncbi:ATP-binding protein [Bacillus cereus group sp. Bc222]|uniref:ATP-binding protein n=1 Tax=Bacillus TaxID=1386 RepID=UPI000C295287|nr:MULTISPECIES: ATP-binding protein [Bacillus]AYY25287.1 ATP-binding protein [Bacillus sp. FDAARGOS_527]MCC2436380.1 ATP-binding protein [Bacillus paranthracis]MCU5612078.1 ATP-binding protein [Bacillus paranthracis]MDA2013061.1 ATP-binding protein [Bacillus cereus group sp. Bcc09]MDA2242074.1 ATP-binding protein [Bacillus cereus group sp. Bc222]
MIQLQATEMFTTKKLNLTSNLCEVCQAKGIKQRTMIFQGEEVCPKCYLQKDHDRLFEECNQYYKGEEERKRKAYFHNHSLISDPTIMRAAFENFIPECAEERTNKEQAQLHAQNFIKNLKYTVVASGDAGRGKSHLMHAIAEEVNENGKQTVLFISESVLFKKLKSTFSKKDISEDDYLQKIIDADVVIFDDFGSTLGDYRDINLKALEFHNAQGEGDITSLQRATKYMNDTYMTIFDGRQGKANGIATNLVGAAISYCYDQRITSRILGCKAAMTFKNTPDKRKKPLPF